MHPVADRPEVRVVTDWIRGHWPPENRPPCTVLEWEVVRSLWLSPFGVPLASTGPGTDLWRRAMLDRRAGDTWRSRWGYTDWLSGALGTPVVRWPSEDPGRAGWSSVQLWRRDGSGHRALVYRTDGGALLVHSSESLGIRVEWMPGEGLDSVLDTLNASEAAIVPLGPLPSLEAPEAAGGPEAAERTESDAGGPLHWSGTVAPTPTPTPESYMAPVLSHVNVPALLDLAADLMTSRGLSLSAAAREVSQIVDDAIPFDDLVAGPAGDVLEAVDGPTVHALILAVGSVIGAGGMVRRSRGRRKRPDSLRLLDRQRELVEAARKDRGL